MSDWETRDADAKRDAYYDKHPEEVPGANVLEPCQDGHKDWLLVETTTYGDDADGNRGIPLRLYECRVCQDEVSVRG